MGSASTIEQVRQSLDRTSVPSGFSDVSLGFLDPMAAVGTGRGGEGSYVFVGPGQPTTPVVRSNHHELHPWVNLEDRQSGTVLKDVCVLRFQSQDDDVLDAIAAVFVGLLELAVVSPDALGAAILDMAALFESGLRSRVSREIEVGLAGELIAIAHARQPGPLVARWHSQPADPFDFSATGERIDVKTTTGSARVHWFSDSQIRGIPGVTISFLSVILPVVEVGSTIASVFARLSNLTSAERSRVRQVIIDTAKEPPETLTSVVFDETAAVASWLLVSAPDVPTPNLTVPGVGAMRWEATLDGCPPSTPAIGSLGSMLNL